MTAEAQLSERAFALSAPAATLCIFRSVCICAPSVAKLPHMPRVLPRLGLILAYVLLCGAAPRSESSPDDPQKLVDIVDEKSTSNTFSLVAVSKVDYAVTVNVELPTLENLKPNVQPPFSVVVQPKKR